MTPASQLSSVSLLGRYYALTSILPYIIVSMLVFFGLAFVAVLLLLHDSKEAFQAVIVPFLLSTAIGVPFLVASLYMLHWHGKRRLDFDEQGVTMVLPGEKQVYVPWEFLFAVELRFQKPRLVVCTLVTGAMRFTFSNLELNLEHRHTLKNVYALGFEMDKLRELLYHLHRMNRNLSWRTTPEFKQQFNILYPPYDLEKLK